MTIWGYLIVGTIIVVVGWVCYVCGYWQGKVDAGKELLKIAEEELPDPDAPDCEVEFASGQKIGYRFGISESGKSGTLEIKRGG